MKASPGFTLIELLVSLTLLGLLFVLLFGGLRFGMRAWEHSAVAADASDSIRTVQELLRSEIERACPHRTFADRNGTPAPPRVSFTGGPHSLTFLGPLPGGAACARLTIGAANDNGLQRLRFVAGVNDPGTDILSRAQSIDIAYRGKHGWENSWNGRADPPDLVRIRVIFPKDDGRVWPELFITPRISADADCTYDPATKSCRGS